MGQEVLFKGKVFGGFDRDDVITYIERLQQEVERYKKAAQEPKPDSHGMAELRTEIERLTQENETLRSHNEELSASNTQLETLRDSLEKRLETLEATIEKLEKSKEENKVAAIPVISEKAAENDVPEKSGEYAENLHNMTDDESDNDTKEERSADTEYDFTPVDVTARELRSISEQARKTSHKKEKPQKSNPYYDTTHDDARGVSLYSDEIARLIEKYTYAKGRGNK